MLFFWVIIARQLVLAHVHVFFYISLYSAQLVFHNLHVVISIRSVNIECQCLIFQTVHKIDRYTHLTTPGTPQNLMHHQPQCFAILC